MGVVHTHGNFLRHGAANLARFAGLTSGVPPAVRDAVLLDRGRGSDAQLRPVGRQRHPLRREVRARRRARPHGGRGRRPSWRSGPSSASGCSATSPRRAGTSARSPHSCPGRRPTSAAPRQPAGHDRDHGTPLGAGPRGRADPPEEMRGSFDCSCPASSTAPPTSRPTPPWARRRGGDLHPGYSLKERLQVGAPRDVRRRRLVPHRGQGLHPGRLPVFPGPPERDDQDVRLQRTLREVELLLESFPRWAWPWSSACRMPSGARSWRLRSCPRPAPPSIRPT